MKNFILLVILPNLLLIGTNYKVCQNCGTKNPENSIFCSNCGYKLIHTEKPEKDFTICPNCNTKNPPEARFCFNCGYLLKKDLFFKDSLRVDTIFFSSPLAESIYVELKRVKQLLLQNKVEEIQKKNDTNLNLFCFSLMIISLGILVFGFSLFIL